jgi:Holliday junction resolvase-like predicted endonuclease
LRIERTAADFLRAKGWDILHHNIRIAHVQIDLLALDPKEILTVVEVKSHSAMVNLSWRQRARLLRVGQVLAVRRPVQIVFAQVSGNDVLLLPVDGLTA